MKVVLSYRRSDTEEISGRVFDRLRSQFGHDSVFMDIDSIPYGVDFRKHIQRGLEGCDALIAIIGSRWLGGSRGSRIHEETDFVRLEIETALQRGIPIMPVLVKGAKMPRPDQVPETLRDLTFRNAAPLDSGRDFHTHVDRIIRSLEDLLRESAEQEPLAREQDESHHKSEKAEWKRLAEVEANRQREEQERITQEEESRQKEQERIAREQDEARQKAEQERITQEMEAARQKAEQERIDRERREAHQRDQLERLTQEEVLEKAELELIENKRIAHEREESRQKEQERLEREQDEARQREEQARLAREQKEAHQKAEQERLNRRAAVAWQKAKQAQLDLERALEAHRHEEQERLAREQEEARQKEQERVAREQDEGRHRGETEQLAQEREEAWQSAETEQDAYKGPEVPKNWWVFASRGAAAFIFASLINITSDISVLFMPGWIETEYLAYYLAADGILGVVAASRVKASKFAVAESAISVAVAGVVILLLHGLTVHPYVEVTMFLVMGLWFAIRGGLMIRAGLEHRIFPDSRWIVMSGVVSTLLGLGLVFIYWAYTSGTSLGSKLFTGDAVIAGLFHHLFSVYGVSFGVLLLVRAFLLKKIKPA